MKTTLLKWLKRLGKKRRASIRSSRRSLKNGCRAAKRSSRRSLKKGRRKLDAEFSMGARCIGIRPIECDIGGPRIPIRDIEPPCPLICAVAVEAAKTNAATQPRRLIFFEFITFFLSKE